MKKPANMDGRWYIGRKIRPIGQNGLCVPTAISKLAGFLNWFFAILGPVVLPKTIFQGISLGY
jgi:hypothetical protein